jgi:signal transduction histidine kinase/CheY-like chemotaxis protein
MHDSTSSARYAQSTLDAVSFGLVLLDQRGLILLTNKPWRAAMLARNSKTPPLSEGLNYLSGCDRSYGRGGSNAHAMAAGIRSVLGGADDQFALDYTCDKRWYTAGVTRFDEQGETRAVVSHLDISARRALELQVISELTFQSEEMGKRAAELVIANVELAYQNEERGKRAAELAIANIELAFQNEEKGKRAAELAIANIELAFQNEEKGKRAAELLIARDEAQSASLAKSSFLANMSHEIRTPLGAIYGMANLIAKEPLTATQADRMGKLQTAFRHLSQTINGILDFSKIEANQLMLDEGPVQLGQMMDNIAAMVLGSSQDKGLQLHVHTETMPPDLWGDSTRLAQALLNYAANAVKFTETGAIHLRAHILEDCPESTLVRLEVQDTGVGIAAAVLPKLFMPFVQTDNSTSRIYGGTGLGLAITRRLAEAMGGQAGVSSQTGQGSTFWFTARLRKVPNLPIAEASESVLHAAEILRSECSGKRVLLVDDDEFNREIGAILLADAGLVVDVAEDGQMAVEMAASTPYDLILMDMQMPRLDGLEATRQIRAAATCNAVPIVAMTANAFTEDRLRCLDAGMNDFVTKPIEPSVLYQVILQQFRSQAG